VKKKLHLQAVALEPPQEHRVEPASDPLDLGALVVEQSRMERQGLRELARAVVDRLAE
jgi:hypothetical protein